MPRGSFLFKVYKKGVLKLLIRAYEFLLFSALLTVTIRYEKIYYGTRPRNYKLEMYPV